MKSFIKVPDAILDYGIDWSKYLRTGITISTSVWVITPNGSPDLVQDSETETTTTTQIIVSEGVEGTDYTLVNHIVMSDALEDHRTIIIHCRER